MSYGVWKNVSFFVCFVPYIQRREDSEKLYDQPLKPFFLLVLLPHLHSQDAKDNEEGAADDHDVTDGL